MRQNTYNFYIGIDVSKQYLDVATSTKGIFQVTNDKSGFKKLFKSLPNKQHSLVVMEASGGYEKDVARWLKEQGCAVAVVNAKRVRDFAKAAGTLAKTDRMDAHMIMTYGKVFNPVPQARESQTEEALGQQATRRAQVIKMLTMEKQHLCVAKGIIKKRILKHIQVLEKELKQIEAEQEEMVKHDAVLEDKVQRLDAIIGVGQTTAITVITHLPELGTLTSKEVAAIAGVAPFNHDSGTQRGKRKTWGGRSALRSEAHSIWLYYLLNVLILS